MSSARFFSHKRNSRGEPEKIYGFLIVTECYGPRHYVAFAHETQMKILKRTYTETGESKEEAEENVFERLKMQKELSPDRFMAVFCAGNPDTAFGATVDETSLQVALKM